MRQVLGAFLEFPGMLVTLFILGYILTKRKGFLIYALLTYILTTPVFWVFIERAWNVSEEPEDVPIVVLGGGLVEFEGRYYPTDSTLQRLLKAFEIWREKGTRIVLSGGGVHDTPEAKVMGEILTGWGVPGYSIDLETESMNTMENAQNVAMILDTPRLNLVTSSVHMRRALYAFRKVGLDPIPVPCDFHFDSEFDLLSLLPSVSTLEFIADLSHEIIGLVYYTFVR